MNSKEREIVEGLLVQYIVLSELRDWYRKKLNHAETTVANGVGVPLQTLIKTIDKYQNDITECDKNSYETRITVKSVSSSIKEIAKKLAVKEKPYKYNKEARLMDEIERFCECKNISKENCKVIKKFSSDGYIMGSNDSHEIMSKANKYE